jgi:hypothetical protein
MKVVGNYSAVAYCFMGVSMQGDTCCTRVANNNII